MLKRVFLCGSLMLLAPLLVGCFVQQPPAAAAIPTSSAAEFESELKESGLVLAKFGATWCGPCKQIDGELSRMAGSPPAGARIVVIDVDEEPALAEKYKVSSIPHLIMFRDGEPVDIRIGFMSQSELTAWIQDS